MKSNKSKKSSKGKSLKKRVKYKSSRFNSKRDKRIRIFMSHDLMSKKTKSPKALKNFDLKKEHKKVPYLKKMKVKKMLTFKEKIKSPIFKLFE